jgi:hypothetical protein
LAECASSKEGLRRELVQVKEEAERARDEGASVERELRRVQALLDDSEAEVS